MIRPFVTDYLAGRTPIPCALCNNHVKFDQLLVTARQIGAGADRHRPLRAHSLQRRDSGRYELLRAADTSKDQSYFLFGLTQEQMSRTRFPARRFDQAEVREIARGARLPVAEKPESQEICFVPSGDYAQFIEAYRIEQGLAAVRPAHSQARARTDSERRTGHDFGRGARPPRRRPSLHHWPAPGLGNRCRTPALRRATSTRRRAASSSAARTNCAATPAKCATSTGSPGKRCAKPIEATVKIRYRHEPAAALSSLRAPPARACVSRAAARHHARPSGGILFRRAGSRRRLDRLRGWQV